jgi:hypothetical protein
LPDSRRDSVKLFLLRIFGIWAVIHLKNLPFSSTAEPRAT